MENRKLTGLRQVFAFVAMSAGVLVHADGKTVADGVYTEEQAERGEALFAEHCRTCHDTKYFRPVFRRYEGYPLSLLYMIMSTSMPQTNPASLPRQDYVDILAYILSLSRYPEGETELDYRDDALEKIAIAPRKR